MFNRSKPEEPTAEVLGPIRERRSTTTRRSAVGPTLIHATGFPQVDPNRFYGLKQPKTDDEVQTCGRRSSDDDTTQAAPSLVSGESHSSAKGNSATGAAKSVSFQVDPTMMSSSSSSSTTALPFEFTSSKLISTTTSSSTNNNNSDQHHHIRDLGDVLQRLQGSRFYADDEGGDAARRKDGDRPTGSTSGEAFVALFERALGSPIAAHRMVALHVVLRELLFYSDASPSLGETHHHQRVSGFRNYILFGPNCGRRLHRLIHLLSQATPVEAIKLMEVLSALLSQFPSQSAEDAEALSELAVPLGDPLPPTTTDGEATAMMMHWDEDALVQLSEDIRTDMGSAITERLLLHRVLGRVGLSPTEWVSLATTTPSSVYDAKAATGPSSTPTVAQARVVYWNLLGSCVRHGSSHAAVALCSDPVVRREIASTAAAAVLERGGAPAGVDRRSITDHSPSTTAPSFTSLSALVAMLRFLGCAFHTRAACFALAELVRPILALWFEHLHNERSTTTSLPTSTTTSSAGSGVIDGTATRDEVMLRVHLTLLLRCMVRHGCSRVTVDFLRPMIQLAPEGYVLAAAELALLADADGDDDAGAGGVGLSAQTSATLAQEAHRILTRPSLRSSTEDDDNGDDTSSVSIRLQSLLAESCALQYLATYAGVEGLKAFKWLAPTTVETQARIQELVAKHLLTAQRLSDMFLEHVTDGSSSNRSSAEQKTRVVHMRLQAAGSYNAVRLLCVLSRLYPVTRRSISGYCETILVRLIDLTYGRAASASASSSAAFTLASEVVGGVVCRTPMSTEELSMMVEVIGCLTTTSSSNNDDVTSSSSSQALSRNATAVSILLLDIIARTKQCLDAVPMLLTWLLPNDKEFTTAHAAVQRVIVGGAGGDDNDDVIVDPATCSSGWVTRLLSIHAPAASMIMTRAISCHARAKTLFGWEQWFGDFVLWSGSTSAIAQGFRFCRSTTAAATGDISAAAATAAPAVVDLSLVEELLLAMSRVALTEQALLAPSVNQSIASTIGPYTTQSFAGTRMSNASVGALCVAAAILPFEGALACLKVLSDARDSFAWTSVPRHATAGSLCSLQAADVRVYLDLLYLQEFGDATTTGFLLDSSRTTTSSNATAALHPSWSSLQNIVECLQLVVPLIQAVDVTSWVHRLCCFIIRRSIATVERRGGGSAFERTCLNETLKDLGWAGFTAFVDREEATDVDDGSMNQRRRHWGDKEAEQTWDDDEFQF